MKILFILPLLLCYLTKGQERDEIKPEDFAERFFQLQDEELNYEDIYGSLLQLYTHPINLNNTDAEELLSLHLLSPAEVNAFLDHVHEYGKLISIYELQAIPLFTPDVIDRILPFVSVRERNDNRSLIQRIKEEENHYLLLRYGRTLEQQKGYQNKEGNHFTGDPNQLYARYRISSKNDFSMGFTIEKDAGEKWMRNDSLNTYLFDFYSFHLLLENKGLIKSLVIGDYQMQLGQGLVFGSGFGFGKGAETIFTTRRNSLGIRPYTSTLESGFFRGSAITIGDNRLSATLLYSNLQQDALRVTDTTYSLYDEFVTSIQSTGYHRTPNEINAKNKLNEQAIGGAVRYKQRHIDLGATFLWDLFDTPIQKKPTKYNQFEFHGSHNLVGSIYGAYLWRNINVFGELARSSDGGQAIYGGLIASISPAIDLSITARNYDKNYHSFYGNGFGENSRIINEKGIYWGLKLKPSRKLSLAAYYDQFSFPWLKFGVYSPSHGYEYLGRISYHISKSIQLYFQYREESKGKSTQEETSNLSVLSTGTKRNLLFNADYSLNNHLDMKTRIQGSTYSLNGLSTSGIAIIQDFGFSLWKLQFTTRAAIFDSDYENRIYAYEKDVLYAFSIPAYSGIGFRTYAVIKYAFNKRISCWLKCSRFSYISNKISSGLTSIEGHKRTDIKAMLRIRL